MATKCPLTSSLSPIQRGRLKARGRRIVLELKFDDLVKVVRDDGFVKAPDARRKN
jgi:hypothetical protein